LTLSADTPFQHTASLSPDWCDVIPDRFGVGFYPEEDVP